MVACIVIWYFLLIRGQGGANNCIMIIILAIKEKFSSRDIHFAFMINSGIIMYVTRLPEIRRNPTHIIYLELTLVLGSFICGFQQIVKQRK